MREGRFIQTNTEKWKTMDAALHSGAISPDLLAHYFIELTDDLAYARTFYPKGDAVLYLNNLARSFHQTIYANKTQEKGRL